MEQQNHKPHQDDDVHRVAELLARAMTPADRQRLWGLLRERRKRSFRLIQGGKIVAVIAFFGGISAWVIRALKQHALAAAAVGGAATSAALATAVWTVPLEAPAVGGPVPEVEVRMVEEQGLASSPPVGPSPSSSQAVGRAGKTLPPPPTALPPRHPVSSAPRPVPAESGRAPEDPDPEPTLLPRIPKFPIPGPMPPKRDPSPDPAELPLPLPTLEVPLPPLPDPVPTVLEEVCDLPLDPLCEILGQDDDDADDEDGGLLGDVLGGGQGTRTWSDR